MASQPWCAGVCDIPMCFFQRGNSECQPSSCQHRAEWIKWLCLGSQFVTCYLSPTWEELGDPFSLAFHRDLPAFSAQSPLLWAPAVTASSYCTSWLSLSIPSSLSLTSICIIFPGIWAQITLPRAVASSSCPCCNPDKRHERLAGNTGGVGKSVPAAPSDLLTSEGSRGC